MSYKRKLDELPTRRRVKPRRHEQEFSKPEQEVVSVQVQLPLGRKTKKVKASSHLSFGEQLSIMKGEEGAAAPSDSDLEDKDGYIKKLGSGRPRQFDPQKSLSQFNSDSEDDIDERPEEQTNLRSKKHQKPTKNPPKQKPSAPEEVTASVPISRRRAIRERATQLPSSKQTQLAILDPRFNPSVPKTNAPKGTYDFLDTYRDDEISALKSSITHLSKPKNTRDERRKAQLKLELQRLLNQKSQREQRKKAEELLREEKTKEKQAVENGKLPFFMKKGERMRKVLEDKVKGMSEREIEKSMKRRRKKEAGREKKMLPVGRRTG
ncbi:kinase [Zalerion maritima]|uniref:rRNA biogenesis protein RRP36 n=1 Tax=Zalerion maritima TaxID=339359 RepID=A0AAD5WR64_9PEZI|nr:kinase [Zalerion maritima]